MCGMKVTMSWRELNMLVSRAILQCKNINQNFVKKAICRDDVLGNVPQIVFGACALNAVDASQRFLLTSSLMKSPLTRVVRISAPCMLHVTVCINQFICR